jgi:hypothetical protein
VVDFILQMASVSERQVTPDELMAEPEGGDEAAAREAAAGDEAAGGTAGAS